MNIRKQFILGRYMRVNKIMREVILDMRQYFMESMTVLSFEEFLMLIKSFYRDNKMFEGEYFNLPANASDVDYYKAYNIKLKIDSSDLRDAEKAFMFRQARKVCIKIQNSK